MSVFGFVLHEGINASEVLPTLDWLVDRSHEVRLPLADASRLGREDLGVAEGSFAVGLDLVVSMGGDGTMLRAADLAFADNVPVLGANLGTLGYLTVVDKDGLKMALKRFLSGSFKVEERMRLAVSVQRLDSTASESTSALNEVVVEKSEPGHTVRLDVELDGVVLQHLGGRWSDRRDPHGFDRVLVLGGGSDHGSGPAGHHHGAGRPSHVVRPLDGVAAGQ